MRGRGGREMAYFLKVCVRGEDYRKTERDDDLVVRVLDSQCKGPRFQTIGRLQSQLSLSSFRDQSNWYQYILGT